MKPKKPNGYGAVLMAMIVSATACSAENGTSSGAGNTAEAAPSHAEPVGEGAAKLTGPQKNAVRSAKQYLRMTGFSRDGLIEQLSSSAGDGYNVSDATVAVDSLNVD